MKLNGTKARSQRYHLIGVGGSGMSGLARLLKGIGMQVTGSDQVESRTLRNLRREGIDVWGGQDPMRIEGDKGIVVRSAAVPGTDPELRESVRRGFESLLYAELVGRLSKQKRTLSIGGTHGKTTTTAMTVAALRGAGIDPSHLVGGDIPQFGGNGHGGSNDLLVVEACEFNRSFHQLEPDGASLLNLDHDHFDCYPLRGDMEDAFAIHLGGVNSGGFVLVNEDIGDPILASIRNDVRVMRVGEGLFADLRALDVRDDLGRYCFVPVIEGEKLPRTSLNLPGRFQMNNALFAIGMAVFSGADPEGACEGVSEFEGVKRRYELNRGPREIRVITDYAHHPAEIRAVLRASKRRYPGRRTLVVFQPHQHQRTLALLDQFADVLLDADHCLVADIYGARESMEIEAQISAADLVAAVRKRGGSCETAGSVSDIPEKLADLCESRDLILVLGAGDIDQAVEGVLGAL